MKAKLPLLLLALLLASLTSHAIDNRLMSNREIFEEIFVPTLHGHFLNEVPAVKEFEDAFTAAGGTIVLDHAATRATSPETYTFLIRIARAFGLEVNEHYEFPEKHLLAVDLQFPDKSGFKWFCTLVDYPSMSPEVAAVIAEDNLHNVLKLEPHAHMLLNKLIREHSLYTQDAQVLVRDILFSLHRGLPFLEKTTLDIVAKESPEAANALLLGPTFNHIAYLINEETWPANYGRSEPIDSLRQFLLANNFSLIPQIQGPKGSKLRQFSTKADILDFVISYSDTFASNLPWPAKFIEFIQRGQKSTGSVFQGFLSHNAAKIYESTSLKEEL